MQGQLGDTIKKCNQQNIFCILIEIANVAPSQSTVNFILFYDNNFLELAAFAGFVLCQQGHIILPPIKCMLADYHNVLSWIRPHGK